MSVEIERTAEDAARSDDSEPESFARSRVLRFVAGFVALVMILLVGYRYAINSRGNIWYLFQVAEHTSWVLGIVGESSDVEPFRNNGIVGKRRQLAEWAAIESGADSLPLAGESDNEPFTPYESWQYEAQSRIRGGAGIADHGPIVRVILDRGIGVEENEIRAEIARLKASADQDSPELMRKIADLDADIAVLNARLLEVPEGPEREAARRGRLFAFRVVPDCGAIPSMSIYLAAVLAFPALWWMRGVGAVGGLAVLYGINILRLATLGYIGAVDQSPDKKWFTFIHEYVWQGVFIVFVVAVWMIWIEFVVKARES